MQTFLFSGIFKGSRLLKDSEIRTLKELISLQIEAMAGDEGLVTDVDLETIVVIPFNDKVEIVVSPELVED